MGKEGKQDYIELHTLVSVIFTFSLNSQKSMLPNNPDSVSWVCFFIYKVWADQILAVIEAYRENLFFWDGFLTTFEDHSHGSFLWN